MTPSKVEVGKAVGASPNGWHRISAHLKCPHEWKLQNICNVRKPVDQTPEPLAIGLMFHAIRARWFASGFGTDERTWDEIRKAVDECRQEAPAPIAKEHEQKALQYGQAYIEFYSKLPLPVPIGCEYLLEGRLDNSDSDRVVFSARLDDVSKYAEAGGRICVGEAKTSSDVGNTINEYYLHGQPMLQCALWNVSNQGSALHGPISGVMLDILQKPQGKRGPKFSRVYMPINQDALAWFVKTIRDHKKRSLLLEWNSDAERNVANCTRMYGRMRVPCEYRELCSSGRTAAGLYIYGNEGKNLNEWEPNGVQLRAPWD